MKVTVLGGGCFRAPMLDRSLASGAQAIGVDEIVFYDTSEPRLRVIANVIRAMDEERGGGLRGGSPTTSMTRSTEPERCSRRSALAGTPDGSWMRPFRSSSAS